MSFNAHTKNDLGISTQELVDTGHSRVGCRCGNCGRVGGRMAIKNSVSKNEQAAQQSAPATPTISATPTNAVTLTNSAPASGSAPAVCIPSTAVSVVRIDTSCPPSLVAWDSKRYTCTDNGNIEDDDITGISAYSLQQCIDACSTGHAVHGSGLYRGKLLRTTCQSRIAQKVVLTVG